MKESVEMVMQPMPVGEGPDEKAEKGSNSSCASPSKSKGKGRRNAIVAVVLLMIIVAICLGVFLSPKYRSTDAESAESGVEAISPPMLTKAECVPGLHDVPNLSPANDPRAPEKFRVQWGTSYGDGSQPIVLEVTRSWSPLGVDRFYQLLLDNYYNCAAFFRIVPGKFCAFVGTS